jgi:hypothetical protein
VISDEWEIVPGEPQISDLDSNRVPLAERLVDQLSMTDPNADASEILAAAISIAERNVPTAKEASQRIVGLRNGPTYCYLAFYGRDGAGQYLKIGMTSHPEQRLYELATGNPLDCLWVYAACFDTRRQAYAAEQSLLRELVEHKRRGEWIEVTTDAGSSAAFARQLGAVVNGDFMPLSYRDGREAA